MTGITFPKQRPLADTTLPLLTPAPSPQRCVVSYRRRKYISYTLHSTKRSFGIRMSRPCRTMPQSRTTPDAEKAQDLGEKVLLNSCGNGGSISIFRACQNNSDAIIQVGVRALEHLVSG